MERVLPEAVRAVVEKAIEFAYSFEVYAAPTVVLGECHEVAVVVCYLNERIERFTNYPLLPPFYDQSLPLSKMASSPFPKRQAKMLKR